jgi:formylmethanofuran dehydrogenase subunit E
MTYGTTRCNECDQDVTKIAQYYDKGKVYCCECNYRIGNLKK